MITAKTFLLSFLFLISINSWTNALKLTTYNIRNFSAEKTDLLKLKQTILKTKSDIIAVQEIVDKKGFNNFIKKSLPQYSAQISNCGGSGRQKLGFLYLKSTIKLHAFQETALVTKDSTCEQGLRPATIAYFSQKKGSRHSRHIHRFVVMNLHLKAGDSPRSIEKRKDQYQRILTLMKKIEKHISKNIIVIGDLNTTGFLSKEGYNKNFDNFQTQGNFKINTNGFTKCTGYWARTTKDQPEPDFLKTTILDHILINKSFIEERVKRSRRTLRYKTSIGSFCGNYRCEKEIPYDEIKKTYNSLSDHCPVSMTIF